MIRKVQLPVIGGVRKVVTVPNSSNTNVGTTIAGFPNATLSIAQLKQLLGLTSSGTQTAGSSGAASLIPGPGLSGGGVLVGAVPINLIAPIPFMIGEDSGGDGGDSLPVPGQQGVQGVPGGAGLNGPAVLYSDQGEEGEQGIPGPAGPPGTSGSATLAGLTDVTLTSPSSGQVLTFNGSKWVNQAGGGGGSANVTPDTHPASPTIYDDEFEFGSSIDLTGARFAGANGWTWRNQSTSTTLVNAGSMVFGGIGSGSIAISGVTQPVTGATWAYTWKVGGINFVSNNSPGGILYNSGTGQILLFALSYTSSFGIIVQQFNSFTSYSGTAFGGLSIPGAAIVNESTANTFYMQVYYDGTNLNFNISMNGVTYQTIYQQSPGSFIGTVTDIGLGGDNNGSNVAMTVYDWFRKTL